MMTPWRQTPGLRMNLLGCISLSELGIGDRAEIEVFNGPHTINGDGTFKFLDKHLKWPEK